MRSSETSANKGIPRKGEEPLPELSLVPYAPRMKALRRVIMALEGPGQTGLEPKTNIGRKEPQRKGKS